MALSERLLRKKHARFWGPEQDRRTGRPRPRAAIYFKIKSKASYYFTISLTRPDSNGGNQVLNLQKVAFGTFYIGLRAKASGAPN